MAATRSKEPESQNQMTKTDAHATILFFGSTTDSVIVLEKLTTVPTCTIAAVVTQPPRPIGRKQTVTPTPTEIWATAHRIPVLSFPSNPEKPWLYADERQVVDALQPIRADILISASYGIKIPQETITRAPLGGINIHPSILPHWRGADPVPWAIMSGDRQIGVTIVTLSETFDQGRILAQEKIPIGPHDTSDPLRTTLFTIGANILASILPDILHGKHKPLPVHPSDTKLPYAKKFKREDGFEPWDGLLRAVTDGTDASRIERKFRALHPWPGIWTLVRQDQDGKHTDTGKRLKILKVHLDNAILAIDEVQLEGKKAVSWKQFADAYLTPVS